MARYFFHIKDGADLIQDPEGSELATMEDARSQALKSARELWADAIKSGRSLGADAVVIADEHGGLPLCPWLKRYPRDRGSWFCKIIGVWRVGPITRQARRGVLLSPMRGRDDCGCANPTARKGCGSDWV